MQIGEHTSEDGVTIRTTLLVTMPDSIGELQGERLNANTQRTVQNCYGHMLEHIDALPLRVHGVFNYTEDMCFDYRGVTMRLTVSINLPRQVSSIDLMRPIFWLKSTIANMFQDRVDTLLALEQKGTTDNGFKASATYSGQSLLDLLSNIVPPTPSGNNNSKSSIERLMDELIDQFLPAEKPSPWPSDYS